MMMMANCSAVLAGCMILAVIANSSADSERYSNFDIRSPKKFCGKVLADTLRFVCQGNYNGYIQKKSSGPGEPYNEEDFINYEQQLDEPSFPFRSRAAAMRLIPQKFRRTARGIINECCTKSCTYAELRTYCAPRRDDEPRRDSDPNYYGSYQN